MAIKAKERNSIIIPQYSTDLKNGIITEIVIKKWLNLQKVIKEEMTLEEIILKHQENVFIQLKEFFKNYYISKLKNRKIFEEIKNPQKKKDFVIEKELEEVLCDIHENISELMFLFRNNYDYIIVLISLISDDDDNEKILSLAELFSVQFYENILIPNPEKEELLLLIFKLLEKEISQMICTSTEDFLEDDTFLGKFITSFNKRQELTGFLSSILSSLISDIEDKSPGNYLGMSLYDIKYYYKNQHKYDLIPASNDNDINIEQILLADIPGINIELNKNNLYKSDTNNNDNDMNEEEESSEEESNEDFDDNKKSNIKNNANDKVNNDSLKKNNNYMINLDINYFEEKAEKEEDTNLKNLYLYQIEQINDNLDIFTNNDIINSLKSNEFKKHRKQIIEKYRENFIFIKSKIDWLIQSLIDKIDIIPYSVRCICKLIFIIIKKKFPNLNFYLRNSFIGKYIFNKCIFPMLNTENLFFFNPSILSIDTKKCLLIIKNVLNHANECNLFNSKIDTEYSIFNHYIMELIPILNKFYEKVIDIELPPVVNNLIINKYKKQPKRDISNDIINEENENLIYNYFNEHSDELFNLQCICFSLDDILFIINLINRNLQSFSGMNNFSHFQEIYNSIKGNENFIQEINSKNKDIIPFYLLFKEEKNSKFENLNLDNKLNKNIVSNFTPDDSDINLVCNKFKFSIKTILRGLNLLNNKDYSYLNMAFNNDNFFMVLKYILADFGELIDDKNIKKNIPLKWYGEYIFNNKNLLPAEYMTNDYERLYDEILIEESKNLNELNSISSMLKVRDGMNLHCAEIIEHKAEFDNFIINKNKDFINIDKIVEDEIIEVCFQIKDNKDIIEAEEHNNKNSNNKDKDKDKDKFKKRTKKKFHNVISIVDGENCPHKILEAKERKESKDIKDIKQKKEYNPYHAYTIRDFILKFSEHPWGKTESNTQIPKFYIEDDILNGKRANGIFQTFVQYKSIIKKHIKSSKNLLKPDAIYTEIADKIEDYIMRQIYIYVYPKKELELDKKFYEQTKKLNWVLPEHLDIKKVYINQLSNAIAWIKKIDEKKSIRDKLCCISNAYNIMNNTIKFSSGKNENAGQDELTPIFQYLIIKAQPPRLFSNINYIKCFLDEEQLTGELGFLLSQMESATCFIMNISYESFRITKEEFDIKFNRKI